MDYRRLFACALLLAGCTTDNGAAPPGGDGGTTGTGDMSATPPPDLALVDLSGDLVVIPDLTVLMSKIGGQCYANSDCTEGKTPTCFVATLINKNGYPATVDGYCSSPCATDQDCGANGSCIGFGGDGRWCLSKCTMPAQCRSPNFACFDFNGGNCYPSQSLDCDPAAGDGTCTSGNLPGGCLRAALGPGKTGICRTSCNIGTGTCPGGPPAHCVFEDATFNPQNGQATGDKYKGGICAGDAPSVTVGASCLMMSFYYPYTCVDGAECDYLVQGFKHMGDYNCRALCYLPGGAPNNAIPIPMGGKVAGPCANGKTCTDVYMEGSEVDTSRRVGYCL